MFALGEESVKKNLKVGVGLMCRHCEARGELFNRIKAGEIGDILLLRAYRNAGPTGHAFTLPKPDGISDEWVRSGRYELVVAGETVAAQLTLEPLYDPSSARVKS